MSFWNTIIHFAHQNRTDISVGESLTGIPGEGEESWSHCFRKWVMFLLGAGLLIWLLWRADFGQMGAAFVRVNPFILVLSITINLLTPIFRAKRFASFFRVYRRTKELSGMMAIFGIINMIFPARSGEVAFLLMLKRRKIIPTVTESLPRWVVLRVFDLLAFIGIILVVATIIQPSASHESLFRIACILFVVIILGGGLGLFIIARMPPPEDSSHSQGILQDKLSVLQRGLQGINDWRLLLTAIFWSGVIWVWLVLALVIMYAAFQTNLLFHQLVWVAAGVLGFSILPVHAPGGVGTMHAVQVGLMVGCGMAESEALAVAIGVHAATLLTLSIQGFLGAVILKFSSTTSLPIASAAQIKSSCKKFDLSEPQK